MRDRLCPRCAGEGRLTRYDDAEQAVVSTTCPRCRGTGTVDVEEGEEPG